jgi:uncharacterized protein
MSGQMSKLESILKSMGSVTVAYSGGVDSTFLLYVARSVLGDGATAMTVDTPFLQPGDREWAEKVARQLGARHLALEIDLMRRTEVVLNSPQRCYFCKRAIMGLLRDETTRRGFGEVIDATQADDQHEFRPGLLALAELGIRSPLAEAGFTKEDIRRQMSIHRLPGVDRPSSPCLATRMPFNTMITLEGLARVGAAETALRELGFPLVRVRDHFPAALVEVPDADITRLTGWPMRREVTKALRRAGYPFVAADMVGYRSGSLTEAVLEPEGERKPIL